MHTIYKTCQVVAVIITPGMLAKSEMPLQIILNEGQIDWQENMI